MPLPYGKCPREDCDGFVVERKTKKRRSFFGCSRYPECDFMTWDKPASEPCPQCGSIMVAKAVEGVKKIVCLRGSCGHTITLEDGKKEMVLAKS